MNATPRLGWWRSWRAGWATLALASAICPLSHARSADDDGLTAQRAVAAIEADPGLSASVLQFLRSPAVPPSDRDILARLARDRARNAALPHVLKEALLRARIRHVFVIFQENRSFDHYFGTFPGANGLFDNGRRVGPGATQPIVDTDGSVGTVSTFLIPQTVTDAAGRTVPLYPSDTATTDHSEIGIDNSLHIDPGTLRAANDRYALDEEGLTTDASGRIVSRATGLAPHTFPTLVQKQMGELAVGHLDCDTVPLLWHYARAFTLFDDFHQTVIGPSTPNAIAMIAGQSGLTQWALHPADANSATVHTGVPIVGDPGPFAGSSADRSASKPPYNPVDANPARPAINQTYASLPLSFMGRRIEAITASDENPALDLADLQRDIRVIAGDDLPPTDWAWFQLGYDDEPLDPTNDRAGQAHGDYIVHHEGPQYFGYLGDNPIERQHLFGQGAFFTAVATGALPSSGVFFIRGGYGNIGGLAPVDPNPRIAAIFAGNDDHPGYSDAEISEASVADTVNAIARSPYWDDSAIIITYDETDGLYDHGPLRIRAKDPNGFYVEAGPRIPTILISPYGRTGAIVHDYSEHSSVIRFVDELFGLTPLADLPDERNGRALGQRLLGQPDLTPADDGVPGIGDLFPAFSDRRLLGVAPPLARTTATVAPAVVHTLPHFGGRGCKALGITPTDRRPDGSVLDPAPADFNPRPSSNPGIPTKGGWTP